MCAYSFPVGLLAIDIRLLQMVCLRRRKKAASTKPAATQPSPFVCCTRACLFVCLRLPLSLALLLLACLRGTQQRAGRATVEWADETRSRANNSGPTRVPRITFRARSSARRSLAALVLFSPAVASAHEPPHRHLWRHPPTSCPCPGHECRVRPRSSLLAVDAARHFSERAGGGARRQEGHPAAGTGRLPVDAGRAGVHTSRNQSAHTHLICCTSGARVPLSNQGGIRFAIGGVCFCSDHSLSIRPLPSSPPLPRVLQSTILRPSVASSRILLTTTWPCGCTSRCAR